MNTIKIIVSLNSCDYENEKGFYFLCNDFVEKYCKEYGVEKSNRMEVTLSTERHENSVECLMSFYRRVDSIFYGKNRYIYREFVESLKDIGVELFGDTFYISLKPL